jgi:hypothetical protein
MVRIEIYTEKKEEIFESLTNSFEIPEVGQKYAIEGDAELIYMSGFGNNFTSQNYITLGLTFLSVPLNILSCFLYEKLKNKFSKKDRLIINGTVIELNEKEIEKILKLIHKNQK